MKQNIVHIALVVRDYDEALDFYVNKLQFELIEDTYYKSDFIELGERIGGALRSRHGNKLS